jgi:hypothetical protein
MLADDIAALWAAQWRFFFRWWWLELAVIVGCAALVLIGQRRSR